MCSNVLNSIDDNLVMIGNPAKPLIKKIMKGDITLHNNVYRKELYTFVYFTGKTIFIVL